MMVIVIRIMIILMSRSQPGESPASYVVQGLMDFLVSKHKIAQELREKLIFKVRLILETIKRAGEVYDSSSRLFL